MQGGKAVISTPYPSAYSVAEALGVPKHRAARLIRLADAIRAGDTPAVVGTGKRRAARAKRRLSTARRAARRR